MAFPFSVYNIAYLAAGRKGKIYVLFCAIIAEYFTACVPAGRGWHLILRSR